MTIAGTVYPGEIPEESATKSMLSLSPHFPKNIWTEGKVELGNAISGHQATSPSVFFQMRILFDGHLYNTDEILQEIQRYPAYSLSTRSELELIAALYSIHRENAFSFLNGTFSLVIYDIQKQEL